MKHSEIYTKFMIEYDKANVTSSYPSLTKKEIATILDRAYLALIALKVTGNNPRKVQLETDIKSIEDLRPLLKEFIEQGNDTDYVPNLYVFPTPPDMLYMLYNELIIEKDGVIARPCKILPHDLIGKFKLTDLNYPWIPTPVTYYEGNKVFCLMDPDLLKDIIDIGLSQTYIKIPKKFDKETLFDETEFELSDTMAEELINLAILMATEITESSRLQTKISTLSLQS